MGEVDLPGAPDHRAASGNDAGYVDKETPIFAPAGIPLDCNFGLDGAVGSKRRHRPPGVIGKPHGNEGGLHDESKPDEAQVIKAAHGLHPSTGTDSPARFTLKQADGELAAATARALNGATTAPIAEVALLEDLLEAGEVLDDFIDPEKMAAELVQQVVTHVVALHAGPVVAFIAGRLAGDVTEEILGGDRQSTTTADAERALQLAYCVLDHQRSGIGDLADNPSFAEFIGGLLVRPLEAVISVGGSAEARRDQERGTDQPGLITVFLAAFEVITAETARSGLSVDPKAPLQPVSFAVLRCLPVEVS